MTSPDPPLAYALFDRGPNDAPTLFQNPLQLIEARAPQEAAAALLALEEAQAAGFWLAGAASYELGYALEPALAALMPAERRAPLLRFGVFDAPEDGGALLSHADAAAAPALSPWTPLQPREAYEHAFAAIMAGIEAGDFYQVNLTHPLRARLAGDPLALYGALRRRQPVRHGAVVALGEPMLLSRSPELFFETSADRWIETRPMKGTAPRGDSPEEDAAVKAALRDDEKNRAENLMIVDLLRNDLSRVCEIGSVAAPDLFRVESYATVHQMVSRVRGRLAAGYTGLSRLFTALFPCGSITGAPKIAAQRAIRRLEPGPREAYCGAIGWAAPDGRARFNVAIRTLSLYGSDGAREREAVLNVGGGIVADSAPAGEYEESLWKARFAASPLTD